MSNHIEAANRVLATPGVEELMPDGVTLANAVLFMDGELTQARGKQASLEADVQAIIKEKDVHMRLLIDALARATTAETEVKRLEAWWMDSGSGALRHYAERAEKAETEVRRLTKREKELLILLEGARQALEAEKAA